MAAVLPVLQARGSEEEDRDGFCVRGASQGVHLVLTHTGKKEVRLDTLLITTLASPLCHRVLEPNAPHHSCPTWAQND